MRESDREKVISCFDDIAWMAIRYAHGRQTYAPTVVRSAILRFREMFPEWSLKEDRTIEDIPDRPRDSLYDLVNK